MESGNNTTRKPRSRREGREEIGGQTLAGSIIGQTDKLQAISEQAGKTADKYLKLFDDMKTYKLTVDTDALDAKKQEFADALEQQARNVRRSTRTLKGVLWLFVVMLFLVFAAGYCYLEIHPWKAKYLRLEQQYIELQTQMQEQATAKTVKKRK